MVDMLKSRLRALAVSRNIRGSSTQVVIWSLRRVVERFFARGIAVLTGRGRVESANTAGWSPLMRARASTRLSGITPPWASPFFVCLDCC